ncbi:hypothetical protein KI387_011209, partial [Taxus chinensis]
GEIQYLKEKSWKMEKNKGSEMVQTDIDDLREVCKMLRKENIIPLLGIWLKGNTPHVSTETKRKILHANLPPHSVDYDKEITLNDVVDGWLLSNTLIDIGVEVN